MSSIAAMIGAAASAYGQHLNTKKLYQEMYAKRKAEADALGVSVADLDVADAIAEKMLQGADYLIAGGPTQMPQYSMLEGAYHDWQHRHHKEPREGQLAPRTLAAVEGLFTAQQRVSGPGPVTGFIGLRFYKAILVSSDAVPVNVVRWVE